jgi:glycosyltransferase involved in cell wall biosynthesis
LMFHRFLRTWQTKIDIFLCSTGFYRDLFVKAGLPANKLVVMPHFVWHDSQPNFASRAGDYALFVGRLDPEKGVQTLLEAWRHVDLPLKIRGSGRLSDETKQFVERHHLTNIEFVGRLEEQELSDLFSHARFLIMPSEGYYETFGMVIIEAYSKGIPVVASNIGVVPELVTDRKTGLLFEVGNAADLAGKAQWMWNHPAEAAEMGKRALGVYREKFTQDQCYKTLIAVYERLIDSK